MEPVPRCDSKILIIDGDEFMRILLRDSFWVHDKYQCFSLTVAETLDEARSAITDRDNRPDIVFLDLLTPKQAEKPEKPKIEDSLSFMQWLKTYPSLSHIKIAVFGPDDEKVEARAKSLGADAYLIKGQAMPRQIVDLADALQK